MEALGEDLLPYRNNVESLGLRDRAKMIFNEIALNAHRERIRDQSQAMTCLLQIVLQEVSTSRKDLLQQSELTLRSSDESAYGIVPSRMSSRLSLSTIDSSKSGASLALEYQFLSFEDPLFTARVYKRKYRTSLIDQLFKTRLSHAVGTEANLAFGKAKLSHAVSTEADLAFEKACRKGDTDKLRHMLRENSPTWIGLSQSCLREAIKYGECGRVDAVVQHDVYVGKSTLMQTVGKSLFTIARVKRDWDLIKKLLKHATESWAKPLLYTDYFLMLDTARVKGDLDLIEMLSKYSPGSLDAMRDKLWNRDTIHHQIR